MDNWFTSIPLAFDLWEKKLTMCGTIRVNKKEFAAFFIYSKNREPRRIVNVISTKHDNEKKKPHIILFYNETKGGVDALDYLCNEYNVKRGSRRWPYSLFQGILNILAVNNYIVYSSGNEHVPRRMYLRELGKSLCHNHVILRSQSLNNSIELLPV
ncbi:hypothetical protein A3Q56_00369 [Intoshia linei]|uniref:PiggyBac transposable element-derived protein domain-containing protein n=1 Tax=Intoshia linei TaxID=1819745 RepID=A0A177BE75_9BILA|nr:hypothetical protein A3Q56_00369 [Intoshia linei]